MILCTKAIKRTLYCNKPNLFLYFYWGTVLLTVTESFHKILCVYITSRTEFGRQMRSRSYLYPFVILLLVILYYYYLQVAQIVILSCFRPLSISILVKNGTFTRFQLVCDGQTDGRMDTPSYRDARTHLKIASDVFSLSSLSLASYELLNFSLRWSTLYKFNTYVLS